MIVGPFLVSSKKLTFFVFKKWSSVDWVFPIVISVLVAFNQHKYNTTNECILLYVCEFNQYKYHKTN